ncbi:MAG: DUF1858 domain-containing protein [Anaerolineae bacterium]|jgi:hybrid cluster-associated redox disulfide protein
MEHPHLLPDLTVAEVMGHRPQTVPCFFRNRIACVGCPIAPFETLAEVAAVYRLDLSCLLNEPGQILEQVERTGRLQGFSGEGEARRPVPVRGKTIERVMFSELIQGDR